MCVCVWANVCVHVCELKSGSHKQSMYIILLLLGLQGGVGSQCHPDLCSLSPQPPLLVLREIFTCRFVEKIVEESNVSGNIWSYAVNIYKYTHVHLK